MAKGVRELPGILAEFEGKAKAAGAFLRALDKFNINPVTGCWVWTGAIQSNGYGRLWDGKSSRYAHRVIYELFNGPIEEGLDIDHLCRNRSCVNPLHLDPVTRSENLRRGESGENIAAPLRKKTHCPRNHKYDEENTRVYRGRRHCRACARERHHQRGEV